MSQTLLFQPLKKQLELEKIYTSLAKEKQRLSEGSGRKGLADVTKPFEPKKTSRAVARELAIFLIGKD